MYDMHGQTVLITGATNGIGLVTARELAWLGARTVIVGRNIEKTKRVCEQIKRDTSGGDVQYLIADLSSLSNVRQLAAGFRKRFDRLNVLIHNAGAISFDRLESPEGREYTLTVNYFAPFLLTQLLLDLLEKSGTPGRSARIVNVASGAHRGARINFDDIEMKRKYRSFRAYSQAKLALVMFTYDLARSLSDSGKPVTVNALHPGFVNSGFAKDQPGLIGTIARVAMFLGRPLGISSEKGAKTSIYLAASEEVEGVTGKYFEKERETPSSPESVDEAAWTALRALTTTLVGVPVI